MIKKRALQAILVLGFTLSPILVAGPASAGVWGPFRRFTTDGHESGHMCIHSFDNCKGYVRFTPHGDVVLVTDIPGDQYGLRMVIKNVTKDPDAREYRVTVHDRSKAVDGSDQPGNLAEKHCFRITIWRVDSNGRQIGHKHYTQVRNYNDDGPAFCHDVA